MYIRRKEVKGGTYYQVVEGYRDAGRVRHRTVASLGRSPTIADAIKVEERALTAAKRELEKARAWFPSLPLSDQPRWALAKIERLQRQLTQRQERLDRYRQLARRGPAFTEIAAPRLVVDQSDRG
jgi:hypothetical protein